MMKTDGHKKMRKIWGPLISGILAFLYTLWWIVFIYAPYCKKRDSLQPQISILQREIEQKKEKWDKYKIVEERLSSSMVPIEVIRSKLPYLKNLKKIVMHLKKRGINHGLIIEEEIPDSYLSPSPYPSEALIHPVNLTFKIKGDFLTIGEFIQFLDEENQHFCHIRSITMERSTSHTYTVFALVKMEMFFQKQVGENHDIL
jgi:hypothetical protein